MILLGVSVFWSIPFILVKLFGFQLYQIKEKSSITSILNKINLSSISTDNDKPSGFFFGKWFIGILYEKLTNYGEEKAEIWLLIKPNILKLLLTGQENKSHNNDQISLWSRSGNFWHINYVSRLFECSSMIPRKDQKDCIEIIVDNFKKKKTSVNYLSGDPGCGKSMIGILLAKELEGSLVRTFSPIDPGDNIENLYSIIEPTEDKPLIIVLDEFDIILDKIHHGVQPHKTIPIQIRDKVTWNQFLDDINLGLYPNVIVILTSNISPGTVKTIFDPSYIRPGRIDNFFSLS